MRLSEARVVVEAALTDLQDVKNIIDTSNPDDAHRINNAGTLRGGKLVGWHVSDDVTGLRQVLKRKASLMAAAGKNGDLGAGFYVSAVPRLWASRARDKWAFLEDLSKSDITKIGDKLLSDIMGSSRYTDREKSTATRDIGHVMSGIARPSLLTHFAGMPYGIPFWESRWLRDLGLSNNMQPKMVEVHLKGKFAQVEVAWRGLGSTLRALRRAGVSGAYVEEPGGTPQLVVWDVSAIKHVGQPEPVPGMGG